MFLDESTHSIDKKGRVSMPKRFHSALTVEGTDVVSGVITFGFEGCLCLYSQAGFKEASAQQNTNLFTDPIARKRQRQFFSRAREVTLDASGRFVVPERFRQIAGIEGEVVMVGSGTRAELWSAERWAAERGDDDDFDSLGFGFGGEAQS